MKNKVIKTILKIIGFIAIIVLIFLLGNNIYNIGIKYKVFEIPQQEDEVSVAETTENSIIQNQNDITTFLNKLYPIASNEKYVNNVSSQYNGIEAYINGEYVSILIRQEAANNFSGLISKSNFDGQTIIRLNVSSKKEIKSVLVGYFLDVLSVEFMEDVPYIFFLMEDGTVEYIDIKTLAKSGYLSNTVSNIKTKGKIKGLENIIKIEQCNLANEEEGYSTAVAIDINGEIFNLFDYIEWNKKN